MLPWWLVKQVQTYGGEIGFAEFIGLTVLAKIICPNDGIGRRA